MHEKQRFVKITGIGLMVTAIAFLVIHSFIIVSDGIVATDIFGFQIPEAPLWTTYIPVVGWLIGLIFEYFSLHGLVGVVIFLTLLTTGHELFQKNLSH